jgi:hypothetical protein
MPREVDDLGAIRRARRDHVVIERTDESDRAHRYLWPVVYLLRICPSPLYVVTGAQRVRHLRLQGGGKAEVDGCSKDVATTPKHRRPRRERERGRAVMKGWMEKATDQMCRYRC